MSTDVSQVDAALPFILKYFLSLFFIFDVYVLHSLISAPVFFFILFCLLSLFYKKLLFIIIVFVTMLTMYSA